jgi:hypothetical protein
MGSFDPTKHLIQLKGKWYLETKYRIQWFREDHPRGCISTEIVSYDPALIKATVYSGEGEVLATAHAGAVDKGNAVWSGKSFEKAETAAIGRALGHAGYGTQFIGAEDAGLRRDSNGAWHDDKREGANNGSGRDTQTDRRRLGNTEPRRVSGTTTEAPKPQASDDLSDRDVASRFIQRWRSQSLSDSEVLAALGVAKLSEWTKGREAADDAVNAWLAGRLAPEADEEQPAPPASNVTQFPGNNWDVIFKATEKHFGEDSEAGRRAHFKNLVSALRKSGDLKEQATDAEIIAAINGNREAEGKANAGWWTDKVTTSNLGAAVWSEFGFTLEEALGMVAGKLSDYASPNSVLDAVRTQQAFKAI